MSKAGHLLDEIPGTVHLDKGKPKQRLGDVQRGPTTKIQELGPPWIHIINDYKFFT